MLPTSKPNFLFENTQDFNQTTHLGPQEPIVFIDNISLYFYAISSVHNLIEEWQIVTSVKYFNMIQIFLWVLRWKASWYFKMCLFHHDSFQHEGLHNQFSKWQSTEFKIILKNKICKQIPLLFCFKFDKLHAQTVLKKVERTMVQEIVKNH